METKQPQPKVRNNIKPPPKKKYPFEILIKRGQSFFKKGADAHCVRQSARSYIKHHSEITVAGDIFRVIKEIGKEDPDDENEEMSEGVGVYREAAS